LRGLLIRHLILPGGLSGTEEIIRFLAEEISTDTYLNLMAQYRPAYRAHQYPELNRPITRQEFTDAIQAARHAGLDRLDKHRFFL
jgi:putative pyruvate formate lyase activating enzyme